MLALPFELIAQIFWLSVHDDETPPLRLGCINQHLRQVALNVPELWKQIDYMSNSDTPRMLLHLERSRTLALSVELVIPYLEFTTDMAGMNTLLDHLTPHLGRIRMLRLVTYEGLKVVGRSPFRFAAIEREYTFLKSLTDRIADSRPKAIHPCEHFEASLSEHSADGFDFPRLPVTLQSLDMRENAVSLHNLSQDLLVLSKLEVLKLSLAYPDPEPLTLESFITSLALLPHLRTLELNIPETDATSRPLALEALRVKPTILSRVQTFRCSAFTTLILPYLYCPVLSTVSLPWGRLGNFPFLERHAKTLVSLEVHMAMEIPYDIEPLSQGDDPVSFPALVAFTGNVMYPGMTRILQGVALVILDLQIYWSDITLIDDILVFLKVASLSLESVMISSHPTSPIEPIELDEELLNIETSRIRFLRLKTFTSGSRMGDIVFAAIEQAPCLLTLQLHGPPLRSQTLSQASV